MVDEQGLILTIPDLYTSIEESAFASAGNDLIIVSIPGTVTEIGARAFHSCPNLRSLDLSNGVEVIGDYAFQWSGLSSIQIPDSVISIGGHAFDRSYDLKSIFLGKGLKVIGDEAFSRTDNLGTGLEALVIPDNVEEIGSHSFYTNYNLSSIQISNSLTVIPERAFAWAYELKSIFIPHGVEVVGYSAFGASGLEEVAFPASLKEIEDYAFYCTPIKEAVLPDSFEKIAKDAFDPGVNISFIDMNDYRSDHDPDPVPAVPASTPQPTPAPEPEPTPEPEPEPEPYDGIIQSVRGKGKLKGTRFADAFTFDSFDVFTKKAADKIIGFDASEGDSIAVSKEAFPALENTSEISFISTKKKKESKMLSQQDYDFVYFSKKGRLYFDGNGMDRDWGGANDGGLVAVLKGKPELSAGDFTLLA